jgi:hypothetical protein
MGGTEIQTSNLLLFFLLKNNDIYSFKLVEYIDRNHYIFKFAKQNLISQLYICSCCDPFAIIKWLGTLVWTSLWTSMWMITRLVIQEDKNLDVMPDIVKLDMNGRSFAYFSFYKEWRFSKFLYNSFSLLPYLHQP